MCLERNPMKRIPTTVAMLWGFFFFLVSCSKAETSSESTLTPSSSHLQEESISPKVKMITIKGDFYQPFYGEDSTLVKVEDFLLDERPVTHEEYLEFVKKNPQWRKSNVQRLFADDTYLRDWPSDLALPKGTHPDSPVVFVSWFAARAYAKSAGKRLPTLDEWEYVAMANETMKNARREPSYSETLINLYNQKNREKGRVMQSKANYHGAYNLFDLVWEWTDDFNSIMTTSDSRTTEFDDKGLYCAVGATSTTDALNYAAYMRYALRSSLKANFTVANLGFRCAKDL